MPADTSGDQDNTAARRRQRRRRRKLVTVDETSAGGVVVDLENQRVALIGRLDRNGTLLWSLPKGHVEEGETHQQTAVREVKEETGISARVLMPLGAIDYWFVAEHRRVHKTVHHFLLEATGGTLSDEDDEVTEVDWVPFAALDNTLAYADERLLARKARSMLASMDGHARTTRAAHNEVFD